MMMSTKLTLYIEDDLITHVKKYAKEHHLSVSKVVNNFLAILRQDTIKNKPSEENNIAPVTASLKGVMKQADIDVSDYYRYLEEKYL